MKYRIAIESKTYPSGGETSRRYTIEVRYDWWPFWSKYRCGYSDGVMVYNSKEEAQDTIDSMRWASEPWRTTYEYPEKP